MLSSKPLQGEFICNTSVHCRIFNILRLKKKKLPLLQMNTAYSGLLVSQLILTRLFSFQHFSATTFKQLGVYVSYKLSDMHEIAVCLLQTPENYEPV